MVVFWKTDTLWKRWKSEEGGGHRGWRQNTHTYHLTSWSDVGLSTFSCSVCLFTRWKLQVWCAGVAFSCCFSSYRSNQTLRYGFFQVCVCSCLTRCCLRLNVLLHLSTDMASLQWAPFDDPPGHQLDYTPCHTCHADMAFLPCVTADVSPTENVDQMPCHTCHTDMASLRCVSAHVSPRHWID